MSRYIKCAGFFCCPKLVGYNWMTVWMGYDFAMIRAKQRRWNGAGIQKRHSGKTALYWKQKRKEVTVLKEMTKGERLVAEMLGEIPIKGKPILTEKHPFLRNVLRFMESRRQWEGTATELLAEIGDGYTPPNTVTKLLNRFDYECFYKRGISIRFHRTNRKRIITMTNYRYKKWRSAWQFLWRF